VIALIIIVELVLRGQSSLTVARQNDVPEIPGYILRKLKQRAWEQVIAGRL
jgi:hypothetical protein